MTATVPDDADADFRALVHPHLRELHVHCYRLLGSVDDADEVLQETLLAAWRGMAGFEGRASVRTWLYRIATNRCLNAIRDGKRQPPPSPVPPFEPPPPSAHHGATWVQPYVTDPAERHVRREHLELAFVTALQLIPPRQTAVLVLVDVLGFSLAETAGLLDESPTAVKGLLQRARRSVATRPRTTRAAPETELHLAARFAVAFAADDVDGVLALLTDEAWLAMPPAPHVYVGREAIAGFLQTSIGWRRGTRSLALEGLQCNDAPAFVVRMSGPGGWQPAGVLVLEVGSAGITGVTRFLGEPAAPSV